MLNEEDKNRIIEMAWEDRTPFADIKEQFGLLEKEVISIMKKNLKRKKKRRNNFYNAVYS